MAPATLTTCSQRQAGRVKQHQGVLGGLRPTVTATAFLHKGAIIPVVVAGQGKSGGFVANTEGAGGGLIVHQLL